MTQERPDGKDALGRDEEREGSFHALPTLRLSQCLHMFTNSKAL